MRVEQVGPYLWRIPPDAAPGMRVPGLVVADEPLMRQIRTDAALAQLANGATLPGIVRAALAMPDIHQGYGLPVRGVVATDVRSRVVSASSARSAPATTSWRCRSSTRCTTRPSRRGSACTRAGSR